MRSIHGWVCAVACISGSPALADIINISGDVGNSTEQTGATFSGTISYLFNGGSSGTAVISLINETPPAVGGFLTGFVFNIDSTDGAASATLTSASNPLFLDTGSESAAPFGMFDAGAALGANWLGGGSPTGGLAVGQTGSFTFSVIAADTSSLSASSFLNGPNEFNFAVRFRGLTGGGSDKVPVPAPASLAAVVLGGGIATRRKR